MLIKSVPFRHIYMQIEPAAIFGIEVPSLPKGYRYRLAQTGDAEKWAKLELSVGEFDTFEAAMARYESEFLPSGDRYQKVQATFGLSEEALSQRQVFIESSQGEVVATATAWMGIKNGEYQPMLHWVSVSPEAQGLGLGRAVVSKAMSLFPILDPNQTVMLHTQTWSYPAVILYHKIGFYLCKKEGFRPDNDFYNGLAEVLQEVIAEPTFSKLMADAKE